MELNYNEDFSLFIGIRVPGQLLYPNIIEWFNNNEDSSYRLIFDSEFHEDNADYKTCASVYEDVKTFAVVSNPWARVKLMYLQLFEEKEVNQELGSHFNFESFEKFVLTWPSTPIKNKWFLLTDPQVNWIRYKDEENNYKYVDYIIRQEHIKEDFKPLQDYFTNNRELSIRNLDLFNKINDYKLDYNTEMKNHIATIFETDCDIFKYTF
jgi:hypothetical protein